MKGFINFTVKQFGQDSQVTAHLSQIYKLDNVYFWQGFPITTHPNQLQKDIAHETERLQKQYNQFEKQKL